MIVQWFWMNNTLQRREAVLEGGMGLCLYVPQREIPPCVGRRCREMAQGSYSLQTVYSGQFY